MERSCCAITTSNRRLWNRTKYKWKKRRALSPNYERRTAKVVILSCRRTKFCQRWCNVTSFLSENPFLHLHTPMPMQFLFFYQTRRRILDRRNYRKLARRIFVFIWHDMETIEHVYAIFLNNGIFSFLSSKIDIFSLLSEIGTTMEY